MNEKQVWRKTHKSLMPPTCRCVKNKWVIKLSTMVCTMCILLACGYNQVLDYNFFENYLPVVNGITFCILLLMVIHFLNKISWCRDYLLIWLCGRRNLYGVSSSYVQHKKRVWHHFKQVHLFPCWRRKTVQEKCCQDPEEIRSCWRQHWLMLLCEEEWEGYGICSFIWRSLSLIGDIEVIDEAITALKDNGLTKIVEGYRTTCVVEWNVERTNRESIVRTAPSDWEPD